MREDVADQIMSLLREDVYYTKFYIQHKLGRSASAIHHTLALLVACGHVRMIRVKCNVGCGRAESCYRRRRK